MFDEKPFSSEILIHVKVWRPYNIDGETVDQRLSPQLKEVEKNIGSWK